MDRADDGRAGASRLTAYHFPWPGDSLGVAKEAWDKNGERSMMGTENGAADDEQVVRRWPNSARSVPRARRELLDTLAAWKLPELEDAAVLVLSELVTNAVRHAGSPRGREIETRFCRLSDGRLRIEVHDAGDHRPVLRRAADTDEGGRGLLLVDSVTAHQWGVSSRGGVGKLVWAVCAAPTSS